MVYALVRIKGTSHSVPDVRYTLNLLKLTRANHVVIVKESPYYKGMIQKVKDYITWGEIDYDTLLKLVKNYSKIEGNKPLTEEYLQSVSKYKSIEEFVKDMYDGNVQMKSIKGIKPLFRLPPPLKGYRSVKRLYKEGGAVGYRGSDINKLLSLMMRVNGDKSGK